MAERENERVFDERRVGLTALTVLFGVQTLRAFFPLLVFIFRDRFQWHASAVGGLCFAVFATGFLASALRRTLGPRRFLLLAAGGVGLLRLGIQLWQGDPLVDFGLALGGLALFFVVLPALPAGGGRAAPSLALGWMIGLAADTALHGAYGTWDMSWRPDPAAAALVLGLVLSQWWLLAKVAPRAGEEGGDLPLPLAWTWAAIGPFLFLEMLVLGNVARLAALSGWPSELASLWTLAGQLLAVGAVVAMARYPPRWPAAALLGGSLAGSLLTPWPTGSGAALLLLAAQVLSAALWTLVVLALGRHARSAGLARLSAAHGVGLLVLAALFFLYYGSIDLRLPVAKEVLPPLVAVLLGVAATFAVRAAPPQRPIGRARPAAAVAAAALLVLPAAKLLTAPEVRSGEAEGFPLRIMTYNLHLGIDPRGRLDLEAIAKAIEAHQPDVVALQEVSRGWLLGGSADDFSWLSRRLNMPGVFAGTADPLWGNAVLSRRPIAGHRAVELPTEDLLIRRGFLTATIDLGPDGRLEVIATHFHHLKDGGEVREMQARELVGFWQGRPSTVILGDLNARPEEPPIELLRRAGLGDVADLAGISPGYTAPTPEPIKRIDYIWISPDLEARDVVVGRETASDHLPVAATLEVAERAGPFSSHRRIYP